MHVCIYICMKDACMHTSQKEFNFNISTILRCRYVCILYVCMHAFHKLMKTLTHILSWTSCNCAIGMNVYLQYCRAYP
jgi:hypothetical protein